MKNSLYYLNIPDEMLQKTGMTFNPVHKKKTISFTDEKIKKVK